MAVHDSVAQKVAKWTTAVDFHRIAGKLASDFHDGATEDDAPVIDEYDTVAHRFYLMHLVGGHDNGLTSVP